MERYSEIKGNFAREFLLLQGQGCRWKKCTYCDYYNDISGNAYEINKEVLKKVTGKTGVIDIINSGSIMEVDSDTINMIKDVIKSKNINTIWFEAHWMYRKYLKKFAKQFEGIDVKYRVGVETFDTKLRDKWNKGIPSDVTPLEIANYFNGVCLLVGIKGQSFESIKNDIEIASKYFEYFSVNIFIENSTNEKRDEELIKRFIEEIYPSLKENPKAEILINNTDLGVG